MHEQILRPAADVWRHHCAALTGALDEAIRELDRLIRLDEYHRHGHDPAHLGKALGPFGSTHLDLSELSRVLGESTRTRAMPPDRLERVHKLVGKLAELKSGCTTSPPTETMIELEIGETVILKAAEKHLNRMATVFSALRIARLESRSKYVAADHDGLFAHFDWRQLNPSELRLCPPFLVIAGLDGESGPPLRKMMSLLESGMPLKVAALRSSLRKTYPPLADSGLPATIALETLPLAMRGVSFVQTCLAAPDFERSVFDGLTSPRPGVVSLLCRRTEETEEAFRLRAERAVRSRAFPLCTYDPDRARGFVACFDLSANPQPQDLWVSESLSTADEHGRAHELSEPFTFAHFAAGETEFAGEFADPEPGTPEDRLTPIAAFLDLSRRQRIGIEPALCLQGPDRTIRRKVASPVMVTRTSDHLHLWRTLQEISGVDNPYVNSARNALHKEFGVQQKALLESLQSDMELAASQREQVAVAAAVRKLVAHLTGVDASSIDLKSILPVESATRQMGS